MMQTSEPLDLLLLPGFFLNTLHLIQFGAGEVYVL